jgi:DNA helicase-2/ATP-dependent DNA helicase PcrA
MTLHSAKGLEFPMVFLPGMEEGMFPHSRSLGERAEVEEERRLCYVGITRARRELVLSAARFRRVFGEEKRSQLSRFLVEIPEELLDLGGAEHLPPPPPRQGVVVRPRRDGRWEAEEPALAVTGPEPGEHDRILDNRFAPGTLVFHATFGEGTVIGSRGEGKRHFLTIDFPSETRPKTIAARFVEPR